MNVKRFVLYALAIGVISAGFWRVSSPLPSAQAAGSCCNYSSDCTGTNLCYYPTDGQAPCSQAYPNYCRE
jgi:hypothetical protein